MINLGENDLFGANLKRSNLERVNLEKTNPTGANLIEANLEGANLKGVLNLSIDQLSKVRTLYNTKLDEKFLIQLKEEFSFLFKSLEQQFLEYQSNLLGANGDNNL
jgi:uncharacterized protein YjbI with pentapeptide repeats